MKMNRKIAIAASGTLLGLYGLMSSAAQAQNTVYFSTSNVGQTKAIADWGVEVAWVSADNMRQSLANMGASQIDLIAGNFYLDEPLQANGDIGPNSKAAIDAQMQVLLMAGNKPYVLGPTVGNTDPYYLNGSSVNTARWAALIKATKQYITTKYNIPIAGVMPFNEPDYWAGQGTSQQLNTILTTLKNDPSFQGTALIAPSTLNSDLAQSWYDPVAGVAGYGSTHLLGGSANSYANFFQHVGAAGGVPSAPELHGLGEAIYAAEYGAQQGLWWGPVLRTRGLFVKSSDGQQLGYAENRANDTAAAVYRAPDGSIRAFAGGFERMGATTPYHFVSTDRDVYFNGIGPLRQYMIQVGQGEDAYADIETGSSVMPALDGYRWKIVNPTNGQVMEVAGAGTDDGALIRSATDTSSLNQMWNIIRTKDGYYELFNANSGRTAEVANSSLANGASVRQWGMADNLTQHWYIQNAGNGSFYIQNANSNKYLANSTVNDIQFDNTAPNFQRFQFVLSNPTRPAQAQYKFEGNVNDSSGTNNGAASGNPTYSSGPTGQGQAISLNGTDAYVKLPSGVASTKDITVAAWVNWSGGNAWQRVFDFGNDTTSYMFLTPLSAANTMRFAITTASNTSEQILDTDPLPIGQWVHVALTLGGNTGVLYVDGAPRVAGQILLNPSDINSTMNYIGKSQWPDPLFHGMIDDFRIYDYALDQAQIANLIGLLPGDANSDRTVNALDFGILASNFGKSGATWGAGDFDSNGIVNTLDFAELAADFNRTIGAPSLGPPVPEPSGCSMLAALTGVLFSRRTSRA
jgi:hypothetical protein